MRILSLTATYPYPPYGGGEARIWEVASRLAANHEVRLITTGVSRANPPGDGVVIENYSEDHSAAASGSVAWRHIRRWGRAARRTWPPVVEAAVTKSALGRLNRLVYEGWPEVVVAEENMAGAFLRFLPPRLPKVWVKHSIYALDAEQSRARSNPPRILPWFVERLARRYEVETLRYADVVVMMAQEDADELTRRYGPQRVVVVGSGADTTLFRWRPDPGTNVAAFVGNFGWQANADAAEWLVKEIWPLVLREVPDARLRLIGRELDSALASQARSQGIEVAGYVYDLAGALSDVAVGLVPIKLGTGVRVKFLEFLSLGIPTVTTRLGARGAGVADGIHCLHAETASQFAAAVAELLLNPPLRHRLSEAMQDLRCGLSWDERAREMEALLFSLTE